MRARLRSIPPKIRGRIYIYFVTVLGCATLCAEFITWKPHELNRLLTYFGLALAASLLKIKLPQMTGSISVNFIFILIGLAEFQVAEAMLVGCLGALIQLCWHARKRPSAIRLFFNIGAAAIAIKATHSGDLLFQSFAPSAGTPVILAVTALGYFLMTTLPVSTAIALTEEQSLRRIWWDCSIWFFPTYMAGAVVAGIWTSSADASRWEVAIVFVPLVWMVYHAYRIYVFRLAAERSHAEENAALHLRTIEALALAINAKEGTNYRDLRRAEIYAMEIGTELRLSENDMKALRAACLLRDIGNMAIPEHILAKPGNLTPAELDRIRTHPIIAADILESVRFPYPVVAVVRAHHEKWDGTGYPDGLRETNIPAGARILAAVDALIALTSDRPYRPPLPLDEAVRKISSATGTIFDPAITAVIERRSRELEAKAQAAIQSDARFSGSKVASDASAFAAPQTATADRDTAAAGSLTSIAMAHEEGRMHEGFCAGGPLTIQELLAVFAVRLKRIVPYDIIVIYMECKDCVRPEFVAGDEFSLYSSVEIPIGQGVSGLVAKTRKCILNGDPSLDSRWLEDPKPETSMRSALSVPLEASDGTAAVLTLYRRAKEAFSQDELRIVLSVRLKILEPDTEAPVTLNPV